MKIFALAVSFIFAIPFVVLGFFWNFFVYSFTKGKELCENYFEYLDKP